MTKAKLIELLKLTEQKNKSLMNEITLFKQNLL